VRRTILALLALALLGGCGKQSGSARTAAPTAHADLLAVHANTLLVDTHNDVPSLVLRGYDLAQPNLKGHTDIARLRQGGVDAVFFAAYVPASLAVKGDAAKRALEMIDAIRYDIVEKHPADFVLATTADEILEARHEGKIAALIGVEGGHAIEDNLRMLRTFYALGARYMTLTHSASHSWADSSGDQDNPAARRNGGLTSFGRRVVAEMNRLGMMVDVSHVSDKTFWDVLAVTTAPPIASHSSCRSLSNIPRNMSDEMIRALAKKGGVIQINFGCEFLSQASADASSWTNPETVKRLRAMPESQRREAAREIDAKMPRAKLSDVVAHIHHAVKIAGIDHVGIGSDFDGVGCTPEGLDDVSQFPNLTRALLEAGYSAEDIAKIYGGNLLRVMREVEKRAEQP
jgi:membrane dipeptidase